MKALTIILSAGVVAGLVVYAVLNACGLLGLWSGDLMTLEISTFVGTLAGAGFGAAALALVLRHFIDRADRATVAELEERLARLERGGNGSAVGLSGYPVGGSGYPLGGSGNPVAGSGKPLGGVP